MTKTDLRFFGQRIGALTATFELQLFDANDSLRNAVWDIIYINFVFNNRSGDGVTSTPIKELYRFIWVEVYNLRIDKLYKMNVHEVSEFLKAKILNEDWHHTYSIIDGFVQGIMLIKDQWWLGENRVPKGYNYSAQQHFTKLINDALEKYNSGYRVIEGKVLPIADENEVAEVRTALGSNLPSVKLHLNAAATALSDTHSPDYRNCIRESITAVEAICRQLTNTSTLDNALKYLETKVSMQSQFKEAIKKLYHYTNDGTTGIRHALMEDSNTPDFADAKYMLVVCSAFINYLTYKNEFSDK